MLEEGRLTEVFNHSRVHLLRERDMVRRAVRLPMLQGDSHSLAGRHICCSDDRRFGKLPSAA